LAESKNIAHGLWLKWPKISVNEVDLGKLTGLTVIQKRLAAILNTSIYFKK
jgi:hypothetical protein